LLGLLTWVATLGDPLIGFVIFFTLSLGLGAPLFVLALYSGQLATLPKSGEWMNWVRSLMGWVLIGMAAYFVRPILPLYFQQYLLAGVAIAAG
jgi:thiol:disulfide interchange protein DsbD